MSKLKFKYINRHKTGNLSKETEREFEKAALIKLQPLVDQLVSNKAYIEVYHTKDEILSAVIIIPENDLDKRANKLLLQVFDK